MAERHQFFTVSIPTEYTSDDRVLLGKRIVSFIKDRTDRCLDKNNKRFKNYSTSYSRSLDFKNAGKSISHPDLQLSGDMIGTLDVLNHGDGFITIGYEDGSEENDKAAWQIDNTQQGFPKRDFLGIADDDLKGILSDNPPSITEKEVEDRDIEILADEEVTDTQLNNIFRAWGLI